jgi:hypothetical protein
MNRHRMALGMALAGSALVLAMSLAAGAAAPHGRFVVNADSVTVKDAKTGLIWQRASPTTTYGWDGTGTSATSSQYYCNHLSLGAYPSGWRLPAKKELETLVDPEVFNPSMDTTVFPGTQSSCYWTSTSGAGASGWAWYVHFFHGYGGTNTSTSTCYVRCAH